MTFPTRLIRSSATPSFRDFLSHPRGGKEVTAIASVMRRLISSGISRSNERSPVSTCAQGIHSFAQTMLQATVEFTSSTTTTMLGLCSLHTFKLTMTLEFA